MRSIRLINEVNFHSFNILFLAKCIPAVQHKVSVSAQMNFFAIGSDKLSIFHVFPQNVNQ